MCSITGKCLPRIFFLKEPLGFSIFDSSSMSTPPWVHSPSVVCMVGAGHQVPFKVSLLSTHRRVSSTWPEHTSHRLASVWPRPLVNINQHSQTSQHSQTRCQLPAYQTFRLCSNYCTSEAHLVMHISPDTSVPTVTGLVNLGVFLRTG